jgi:hypothetical protein
MKKALKSVCVKIIISFVLPPLLFWTLWLWFKCYEFIFSKIFSITDETFEIGLPAMAVLVGAFCLYFLVIDEIEKEEKALKI